MLATLSRYVLWVWVSPRRRVLSWARSEVGRLVPAGLVASRSRRWLDAGSDGGLPLFDTEGKLPGCVAGAAFHTSHRPYAAVSVRGAASV